VYIFNNNNALDHALLKNVMLAPCLLCCCVVTNRLPTAEPVRQQSPPPAAAVDTYTSPNGTDPTHARGGHGIFGEPMVSRLVRLSSCL